MILSIGDHKMDVFGLIIWSITVYFDGLILVKLLGTCVGRRSLVLCGIVEVGTSWFGHHLLRKKKGYLPRV